MSRIMTPKELLFDLVAFQSDTFTTQETAMAKHVFDLIRAQDYWQEHPDLCGLYDGGDVLGRLIPWALRRGKSDKTIVLSGHFDCVEIDSYGILRPFALDPARLKEEMLKLDYEGEVLADLQDENWCFGRGTADMKSGLACITYELFKYAKEGLREDLNVLFVAVHDEEHQAEGIKQAILLLNELKVKHGLDYRFLLNPEPALRRDSGSYVYVDGSIGKMLPGIVVRGAQCHVVDIMNGLNSVLIAANVARKIDLNVDLCCEEFGQKTPPPAVLCLKDSKYEYNVSTPNYTEIYAHVPLTKNKNMPDVLLHLRELCEQAAAETESAFDRAWEAYYGADETGERPHRKIKVLTASELEEICRSVCADYEVQKAALFRRETDAVNSGSKLIQSAGFAIIEKMIELSRLQGPLIVIGLLPPYVPPVNNHYMKGFDREAVIDAVAETLRSRFGLSLEVEPYSMGMSDNSYMSCTDIDGDIESMKNMVTPKELYDVPFAAIARVAMPSAICGPWGKDFHTATERVYLPDVEVRTPAVIEAIIESI